MTAFVRNITIFVATLLVGIVSICYLASLQPKQAEELPAITPPSVSELLELVNKERAKVGVAPLAIDERLNQSAQRKADDMTKYNYFDHVSPNDGRQGGEYANDTGIKCIHVSENIRQNVGDLNSSFHAVNAWMKSKLHREAMLSGKYKSTGFGVSGLNIVQHFCEP